MLCLYTNYTRLTLKEVKSGSVDTHALAISAGKRADASKTLADAAKAQADSASAQASSMKDLAGRALTQARATNALAVQSKRSADIADSQRASPWVGLEEGTFRISAPRYLWREGTSMPKIIIDVSFAMRNFGTMPALHLSYPVQIVAVQKMPFTSGWVGPGKEGITADSHLTACPVDKAENGAVYLADGEMILPGERRQHAGVEVPVRISADTKQLGLLSIAVCVVYFGEDSRMHGSGYLFAAPPELPLRIIPVPGHPDWGYTALNAPVLFNTTAR